jgi:hypothetical protein
MADRGLFHSYLKEFMVSSCMISAHAKDGQNSPLFFKGKRIRGFLYRTTVRS